MDEVHRHPFPSSSPSISPQLECVVGQKVFWFAGLIFGFLGKSLSLSDLEKGKMYWFDFEVNQLRSGRLKRFRSARTQQFFN